MKNEYSFEHFQKRREDIKNRNSRTKQTLLRLFLTTFSIVLFSFLVLAALMSPNLNIPALNDDDTENVNDVSSSDFKSRIDYRLKQIQVDDGTNKMPQNGLEATKENAEEGKLQSILSGAQKVQDGIIKVDLSTFDTPQLPAKTSTPPSASFKNNSSTAEQYAPPKPKAVASQSPQQQTPTPYVPKSQLEQAKSYKLLVGNYSSPEEAQAISDMFSTTSSAGKTHIKSYNGIYCVQVGSYSDFTKAQNIANAYRSKNYKVRVVEE